MVGIWSLAFLESLFEIFSSLSVLSLQREKERKREREIHEDTITLYTLQQAIHIYYNRNI